MEISERSIRQCSLTLGQFDSESVNILVTLFHHQNACSQLTCLSHNLKEKFENLLTTKTDNDGDRSNDTPLTRIELAVMIHFKQKYLSESFINNDNDNNQLKLNMKFSIEDELNLAYCFLLAQIDDRLSKEFLDNLSFLLTKKQNVNSLFDIYEKSGENFPNFFSLLFKCKYFEQNLVIAHQLIEKFKLFIQRYEDFIRTFESNYKVLPDNGNYTQTDAILNQNDTKEISTFMSKFLTTNRKPLTSAPVEQPSQISLTRPISQPLISSSSNIPKRALCVIINISAFLSSDSTYTPKRTGSDKDVELIKLVFGKLKFTVLECRIDFKKSDLDQALNHIDDPEIFGDFDCLVMFIMSHGLLHSFFTADSKEIIIRDIVKRYSDSSPNTIWNGKCRMFFIQACRSLRPEQHNQPPNYQEVQQNDLSPRMLVAYSCSATEASKRSPTHGSIFIQILCIMLVRYSHYYQLQTILEWTGRFVMKGDEYRNEHHTKKISIQTPEYIEREFNQNFRFSNYSLFDNYRSFLYEEKSRLSIPLRIWKELYDLVFLKNISEHEE